MSRVEARWSASFVRTETGSEVLAEFGKELVAA